MQRKGLRCQAGEAYEQAERVTQRGAVKPFSAAFPYQNAQNKEDRRHENAVSRVGEKPEHSLIGGLYRRELFRQSKVAVAEQSDDIENHGDDTDPAQL